MPGRGAEVVQNRLLSSVQRPGVSLAGVGVNPENLVTGHGENRDVAVEGAVGALLAAGATEDHLFPVRGLITETGGVSGQRACVRRGQVDRGDGSLPVRVGAVQRRLVRVGCGSGGMWR